MNDAILKDKYEENASMQAETSRSPKDASEGLMKIKK
jgi:hypothetical protein